MFHTALLMITLTYKRHKGEATDQKDLQYIRTVGTVRGHGNLLNHSTVEEMKDTTK
jgi:hypothetical protein